MATVLQALIETARSGDRQSLNQLAACVDRFVRIHHGSLSRQVRKSSGSTIDFVLEGLAEALAKLNEFQGKTDEEFYAWISHYIRHRIVDAGRREGRQKRAGKPSELGSFDIEAPAVGVSSVLAEREIREAVAQALMELQVDHPQEMEVVVRRLFEEESWATITENLALSSVKRGRTLYAHGLDRLRPAVENSLGESTLRELFNL